MSEPDEQDWPNNYFNYFTEIEEHFQRARGTSLFLLSPLDWAIIESWKEAGIPLEAVLKGIDSAFEKWRARKVKRRMINSLAYCAQAVLEMAKHAPTRAAGAQSGEGPFQAEEIGNHLHISAASIRMIDIPALNEIADSLDALAADPSVLVRDLEAAEQRLTALEDKMVAIVKARQTEQELFEMRVALDRELNPYRGKMTAEQLSMLERRYIDTATLKCKSLPRLSLFYVK